MDLDREELTQTGLNVEVPVIEEFEATTPVIEDPEILVETSAPVIEAPIPSDTEEPVAEETILLDTEEPVIEDLETVTPADEDLIHADESVVEEEQKTAIPADEEAEYPELPVEAVTPATEEIAEQTLLDATPGEAAENRESVGDIE